MNFLAHLYLSGTDSNIIIGNFIGDSVKGNDYNKYPDPIKQGILLHRKIDFFTDNHPIVLKSKERLRPKYRKYSPVIADVFYDHFLASNWDIYSKYPLEVYTKSIYKILLENIEVFPNRTANMLPFMISGNWLFNYKYIKGIEWALKGMSKRTKFISKMETAHLELVHEKTKYLKEFNVFFPELIQYVKEQGIDL